VRGVEHLGALALAKIIVRAPHDDVARRAIIPAQRRVRKAAALAHDVGEHAIPAFVADTRNGGLEHLLIFFSHVSAPLLRPSRRGLGYRIVPRARVTGTLKRMQRV